MSTKQPSKFLTYIQEIRSLNPQECGSWSIPVKLTTWVFITLTTVTVLFFILIKPVLEKIEATQVERSEAIATYEKEFKVLASLQAYKKQLADMQKLFDKQLEQLPKESEIPGLVEDISVSAKNSGLKVLNINLAPEQQEKAFIDQPIVVKASGDYHSFGNFVSAISKFERIINLSDFEITTVPPKNAYMLPRINYEVKANTYRYIYNAPQQGDGK